MSPIELMQGVPQTWILDSAAPLLLLEKAQSVFYPCQGVPCSCRVSKQVKLVFKAAMTLEREGAGRQCGTNMADFIRVLPCNVCILIVQYPLLSSLRPAVTKKPGWRLTFVSGHFRLCPSAHNWSWTAVWLLPRCWPQSQSRWGHRGPQQLGGGSQTLSVP